MSWLGVITNAGKALYDQFSLSGTALNITGLKLGSGTVEGETAMRQRTALVSEETTGVVESKRATDDGPQFRLRAGAAPTDVGSYTLKEMGLIATVTQNGTDTDVLFAYFMNSDGVGIPSETTFPDFVYILSATLILDNTVELSFTIPASSYVSYTQFTEEQARVDTAMGNLKPKQSPVADPTASGTGIAFIAGITQDENGVISPSKKTVGTMGAATSSAAGSAGLVPAPTAGKQASFLRGDGTWAVPVNTTYSAGSGLALNGTTFSLEDSGVTAGNYGMSSNTTGNEGTTINVPYLTIDAKGRVTGASNKVFTAKNTTYSNMTGATASAAGKAGLVPAPAAGKQASFLRGDGTWAVPTNTTYSAGTGLTLTGTTFSISSANVSTIINLLDTGNTEATGADYLVAQYAGGGTSNNNYYRRPVSKVVNGTVVKTALGVNSTHGGAYLRKDGTWVVPPNTTYNAFGGATSSAAGSAGLVPAPSAGKQASFLRGDGTWAVPTNTTYSNMGGATASSAGTAGLVPAPAAGKQASFLRGDGTWAVPTNTTYSVFVKSGGSAAAGLVPKPSTTAGTTKYLREDATWAVPPNTTYSVFGGATSSAAGSSGLVPAPAAGDNAKFLRGDKTWAVPTNTTYSNMTGASASAAGKAGLVPAPAAGKQGSYLRGDGTWAVPTNTTYSNATQSASGLMSAADKTKLDGIASGAQVNRAIQYKHYEMSSKYTVQAGATVSISASWLGYGAISGYVPAALRYFNTGSSDVVPQSINIANTDANKVVMILRNVGSGTIQAIANFGVIWVHE